MIKSAQQYPIHTLLSHDGNLKYRVPPYQREYSWQKAEWEDLFQDWWRRTVRTSWARSSP